MISDYSFPPVFPRPRGPAHLAPVGALRRRRRLPRLGGGHRGTLRRGPAQAPHHAPRRRASSNRHRGTSGGTESGGETKWNEHKSCDIFLYLYLETHFGCFFVVRLHVTEAVFFSKLRLISRSAQESTGHPRIAGISHFTSLSRPIVFLSLL